MAITLDSAVDALNRYNIAYRPDIISKMRHEMVTEQELTARPCENSYAALNVTQTDVVQPFQCSFTPKGDTTFSGNEFKLQQMKIDLQWTCADLEKFFDSYMIEWYEPGIERTEWGFPKWLYSTQIIPVFKDNMETQIVYNGEYAAPTSGTAGATGTSCDGLGTVIADAIDDSKLTPIAVGSFTATTYVDVVNDFISQLPYLYRNRGGKIYMSPDNVRGYAADFLERYKTTIDPRTMVGEKVQFAVPNSNFMLVGLPSMVGKNRMIYSGRPNNLIYGVKRGQPVIPVIRWQVFERTLKGLSEFHRFYGVEYWPELFVSDQE